jgi:hypothetical protein
VDVVQSESDEGSFSLRGLHQKVEKEAGWAGLGTNRKDNKGCVLLFVWRGKSDSTHTHSSTHGAMRWRKPAHKVQLLASNTRTIVHGWVR